MLNVSSYFGTKSQKSQAEQYSKLVFRVRVIIESFRHFVSHEWQFDNKNVRDMYSSMTLEDK